MNVSIVGTAGLPANYGGFETLVENLVQNLAGDVTFTVYCSRKNSREELKEYLGAQLSYVSLDANGVQSIPYDIISLLKAVKGSDVILILGVSGCVILPLFKLLFRKQKLVINIDGLEHRREKWGWFARKFLRLSERFAVKYADIVVSDNRAIQDYVLSTYGCKSKCIAYGGDHAISGELKDNVKRKYSLPDKYAFKVCRIEPENNLHVILEAFKEGDLPLVVIGNWNKSDYGLRLRATYSVYDNLFLLDPIYDPVILGQLRGNCRVYIHGHSAGGTNPSLVEAMYLGLPIIAFDVSYNRETTKNKALYFNSVTELKSLVDSLDGYTIRSVGHAMKTIASKDYTWRKISNQYYDCFSLLLSSKSSS